jgi:hypothetical protein
VAEVAGVIREFCGACTGSDLRATQVETVRLTEWVEDGHTIYTRAEVFVHAPDVEISEEEFVEYERARKAYDEASERVRRRYAQAMDWQLGGDSA